MNSCMGPGDRVTVRDAEGRRCGAIILYATEFSELHDTKFGRRREATAWLVELSDGSRGSFDLAHIEGREKR